MDWANEDYVRVYTRDTADDMVLSWQATALWHAMLRKFDRSGLIATKHGWMGLAKVVRMPDDVVTEAGQELLADGRVTKVDLGFFCPNFVVAQTTRKSDKHRQRESRDRRREMVMSNCQVADITNSSHNESRDVTRGHTRSRTLTDLENQSREVTLRDATRCSATEHVDPEDPSKSVPPPDGVRDQPTKLELQARKIDQYPTCWKIADAIRSLVISKNAKCSASRLSWKDRGKHRVAWAYQVFLMLDTDGRTVDEVRDMYTWIKNRPEDQFNVQVESTGAMREKWDKLENEKRRRNLSETQTEQPRKIGLM